jgi:hypothetical protein
MPDIPADLQAALDKRYALTRVLGRGGMATVYLADDRKHHRPVALKARVIYRRSARSRAVEIEQLVERLAALTRELAPPRPALAAPLRQLPS